LSGKCPHLLHAAGRIEGLALTQSRLASGAACIGLLSCHVVPIVHNVDCCVLITPQDFFLKKQN
jgi:hypothetical protein